MKHKAVESVKGYEQLEEGIMYGIVFTEQVSHLEHD